MDALNRELLAKHYKYARPGVSDTPWRTREMTIKDPFGNRLVFSQPIVAALDFPGAGDGAMSPVGLTAQWVAASRPSRRRARIRCTKIRLRAISRAPWGSP